MAETSSVKISSDAKIILDTIHQRLRTIGIKVTEQKILNVLIEHSDMESIKKLLQKEENTALLMLEKPARWGVSDSSTSVDKYVYGEK